MAKAKHEHTEQTVVIIKPDGVFRALVGEITMRFEKAGLKLVACKMVHVDADLVGKHYRDDEDYLRSVGEKSLENYKKYGFDPGEHLGTKDPVEIGRIVRGWNIEFLSSGPVVVQLWEAPHAIEIVRKIVGFTFPQVAPPGTIRGDFSMDSPFLSNTLKRPVKNLIHASGDKKEAELEKKLWFREDEIHAYKRVDEDLIYG
jgi:nucleoside-diphosphate kinase